jgi:adenylate cyclase
MSRAFELAKKALAMDESDAQSYRALAAVYMFRKEYERALSLFEQAIELDPNDAYAPMNMAWCLLYLQRPEEAIPFAKRAMRLNPLDKIFQSKCILRLGIAYGQMQRYEEAISACKKAVEIRPNHWASWIELAVTYSYAGHEEDARLAVQELLRIHPKFSLEKFAKKTAYKDKDRRVDALRKAGLK